MSGAGVDPDEVPPVAGQAGSDAPAPIRAFLVNRVRLPHQKFDRNPEG